MPIELDPIEALKQKSPDFSRWISGGNDVFPGVIKAPCPKCGGHVHKLMSSPAFQFKGSGWYVTDYAKKDSSPTKTDGGKASDADSKRDASDKTDSGGKSDTSSGSSASSDSSSAPASASSKT